MSYKVQDVLNYNSSNIITLQQNVISERYLVLDLWDKADTYNQIFLRLSNMRVDYINNDCVYFDK